jgi:hypothetical protein
MAAAAREGARLQRGGRYKARDGGTECRRNNSENRICFLFAF